MLGETFHNERAGSNMDGEFYIRSINMEENNRAANKSMPQQGKDLFN